MSLKKVEQVKKSKWFRPWDLLIYGLLAAIIAAFFIAFALVGRGGKSEGFAVAYKGGDVFLYYFDGDYDLLSREYITVEEETEERLLLTFHAEGGEGFNRIEIDRKNNAVRIIESDCSQRKDCVYTPALTEDNRAPIICTPHALTISLIVTRDDGVIKT